MKSHEIDLFYRPFPIFRDLRVKSHKWCTRKSSKDLSFQKTLLSWSWPDVTVIYISLLLVGYENFRNQMKEFNQEFG